MNDRGAEGPDASALEAIGLRLGELVRFRRVERGRWQQGTVRRLERDGSLQVHDADGAARNVGLGEVWVAVRTGGGRVVRWEALAERSSRAEQLTLQW